MTRPEALRLAEWAEWFCRNVSDPEDFRWQHMAAAAAELRRLHAENERLRVDGIHSCHAECQRPVCRLTRERNVLLEALKSTGLFLHHCWCDVQMNKYSFEKLTQQMAVVDAAIKAVEEGK